MSRYIDADALKEQMLKYGFHSADQTVTEFVEDTLPTADVVPMEYHERCLELEVKKRANMVEVVRCKDCVYWQTDWIPNTGGNRGCHYCEMMDSFTEPLNYCGYAERKILPKD